MNWLPNDINFWQIIIYGKRDVITLPLHKMHIKFSTNEFVVFLSKYTQRALLGQLLSDMK